VEFVHSSAAYRHYEIRSNIDAQQQHLQLESSQAHAQILHNVTLDFFNQTSSARSILYFSLSLSYYTTTLPAADLLATFT
jgi:hypothetical protein